MKHIGFYKKALKRTALYALVLSLGILSGCAGEAKETGAADEMEERETGKVVMPKTRESHMARTEWEKERTAKELGRGPGPETPPEPSFAGQLSLSEGLEQLIIVEAETEDSSIVTVSMHERREGIWTEILRTEGYAGYGGIAKEKEGDGRTPTGVYGLSTAFGTEPDPGAVLPYTQVDESYWWVGDYESRYFNRLCRDDAPDRDWKLDPEESEHLTEYSGYEYCLFIEYNTEGIAGKGSCIFMHCIGDNPPTLGCVAVPEEDMVFVLRHVREGCRILIDTTENLPGY